MNQKFYFHYIHPKRKTFKSSFGYTVLLYLPDVSARSRIAEHLVSDLALKTLCCLFLYGSLGGATLQLPCWLTPWGNNNGISCPQSKVHSICEI